MYLATNIVVNVTSPQPLQAIIQPYTLIALKIHMSCVILVSPNLHSLENGTRSNIHFERWRCAFEMPGRSLFPTQLTNSSTFSSKVAQKYSKKPEKNYSTRTANSLRSHWTVLQRQVQKYLAAERAYWSKQVRGEASEDDSENIMRLYCSRKRETDS